jgi:DNA-binding transcriptional LysR family regulator
MNLHDIEAFVAVAETGSVNRAAVRLNLTQPATTRRIQNFEAAIGDAPLFNRTVKPALLTSLGSHVLEHCRRVLAAVADLEACTVDGGNPVGNLRLGVAHGLGEIILTTPLDDLRRMFPRITLQISSNWSTDLIAGVRDGSIDCAIGLLTQAHAIPSRLMRIALGAEQVVVVTALRSLEKPHRKRWRLRDIADQSWFLNPPGCGCRAALTKAFDQMQLPLRIGAEILGEGLQLSLLAQSGGLGLVPRRQFEQSPHRHELRILDVQDFIMPATVTLIRNAAPGHLDPAISLLVSDMKARLK